MKCVHVLYVRNSQVITVIMYRYTNFSEVVEDFKRISQECITRFRQAEHNPREFTSIQYLQINRNLV